MTKQPHVDINYQQSQADFMQGCMREIVRQEDYTGMGGHGSENHGGHGQHSQVSIGLGDTTVNFRELAEEQPPRQSWQ